MDSTYAKKQKREVVKRQDVLYGRMCLSPPSPPTPPVTPVPWVALLLLAWDKRVRLCLLSPYRGAWPGQVLRCESAFPKTLLGSTFPVGCSNPGGR